MTKTLQNRISLPSVSTLLSPIVAQYKNISSWTTLYREICRPTTSHLMMQQREHAFRRSHSDGNQPNSAILRDQCLFCKKSKYKPNTKTREKLHSVQEVCADDINVPYPANYMIQYPGISVQISHSDSPSVFSYMP